GLTKIVSAENVRMQVVEAVAVDGGVRGGGVEARVFEHVDGAPDREGGRRNVFPGGAGVFGYLDVAVVAADPNQTFGDGRRRDGEDGSGRLLGIFFVHGGASEVGADGLPTDSGVA